MFLLSFCLIRLEACMPDLLARILDESLRFEFLCGGVSPIRQPHSTSWRVLPGLMCSQIQRGRFRILLEGGAEIPVPTGSLMLLAAGTRHCVDLMLPTGRVCWVHVNFYILHNLDLFTLVELPPVVPPKTGQAVGDLIEAWIGVSNKPGLTPLELGAHKHEFGFSLLRLLSPLARVQPDALERMALREKLGRVLDHMHRHFDRPLRRDELAKLACLSSAQFHRLFLLATGSAPMDYLRQLRLRQAQQRLLTTALPVAEIAAQVGYEDVFVFSKFFKRSCGLPPSEYRSSLHEIRMAVER